MKIDDKRDDAGKHWTVRYAKERLYFSVLKQFMDLYKFGRAYGETPYHVNPSNNPYPFWPPHARTRCRDKFTHECCLAHLRGEDALFIVNTPRRTVHEVTFDIDDVDGGKPCDGFAVADVIKRVFIPTGAEVFIEPSRHRRGAYLRMLIKRTSSPKAFNKLLMGVCRSLRERHNQSFIERFNAKICGIKGTVWYRFDNPRFDSSLHAEQGGAYEHQKRTYFGTFEPVMALERYRYSRGVLVTAACFGCYADAPERYQQYLDWATHRPDRQVITEEHLTQWLRENPVSGLREKESDEGGGGGGEINSICQTNEGRCEAEGDVHGDHLNLVPLRSVSDAWKRGVECYKRLCRFLNRPATYEELWTAYHEQGLNTGGDVDGRRSNRLRKVADIYGDTFDESKSLGGGFRRRSEGLLRLVKECVRPEHHVGVKYKGGISDVDLAVALYVVEVNSFKLHRDPDQQYTCGNDAFEGMFAALTTANEIDRACKREKAVALKHVLQQAKLVRCLDPKWVPQALSRRGKGTSKKYGLGERHPRHAEFEFVLKHQPVVRIGERAAPTVQPQDVLW